MNEVDTARWSRNLASVRGSHPRSPVKEEKEEAGPALWILPPPPLCTWKIESSFSESLNVFSETFGCNTLLFASERCALLFCCIHSSTKISCLSQYLLK